LKVLLTGATGFIGSHVLAELNSRSVETVAVTRQLKKKMPDIKNGRWVQLNIEQSPDTLFNTLGQPDILIHLAWQGLPQYGSLHHFERELPIHYVFIKQLIKQGLKHVVAAGTCFEYGMQSGALAEHMDTNPNTPYGFAKDTLRGQLQFLQRQVPFNLTWARFFYLHGEKQSATSLNAQLKTAVCRGDKCFNMSGGEQLRDYLPVDEAVSFLVMLAISKMNNGVVNICSGTPVSVRTLVEKWIKENGWQIKLNIGHFPYPDYEPMAFWGDSTKLLTLVSDIERLCGKI
jgi:dTDP-6-deoxy-L-talose 4-dehydrogenase (NAD+)